MARGYDEEERGYDTEIGQQLQVQAQFSQIVSDNRQRIDQVTPETVTADQNNYSLPQNQIIRITTDASRTFTGFAGARDGIVVFANVGGFDAVIANDSASSAAPNRVLCHTGANITLGPKESALLFYDFVTLKWRTIGF
jgi:hypothetical protein